MPEQQEGGSRAAAWLLAEFDATDPAGIAGAVELPGWCGPVLVQPMFAFKDLTDTGAQMRVSNYDYDDPWRWWL